MLTSWDKLWWASLHPQKFQKILVCSKKGFTVFTGPPRGYQVSIQASTLSLPCKWMCCIPQSLHLPEKREPQHVPKPLAHTLCMSTTSSEPCTTVEQDPRLLPLPKQHLLLIFGLSVMLQIYSCHSAGFMSQTPAVWRATTLSVLGLREVFLRGKDVKVT